MSTPTLTVPAALVALVREGAYAVSRDISEAIDTGDDLTICRDRLTGVCRLLDQVGWSAQDPNVDTQLDVRKHAPTLTAVVDLMLGMLKHQAAAPPTITPPSPNGKTNTGCCASSTRSYGRRVVEMAERPCVVFGKALRAARVDRGFSQADLARAASLHRTHIPLLETGAPRTTFRDSAQARPRPGDTGRRAVPEGRDPRSAARAHAPAPPPGDWLHAAAGGPQGWPDRLCIWARRAWADGPDMEHRLADRQGAALRSSHRPEGQRCVGPAHAVSHSRAMRLAARSARHARNADSRRKPSRGSPGSTAATSARSRAAAGGRPARVRQAAAEPSQKVWYPIGTLASIWPPSQPAKNSSFTGLL
jgi:hypothetical protein